MIRQFTILAAALAALSALPARADGDPSKGEKVFKKCAACHQAKFGGDGAAVYRPGERITTAGALRGMVEQCNTELGMGLFPEEVNAIAAVLNQRHYQLP